MLVLTGSFGVFFPGKLQAHLFDAHGVEQQSAIDIEAVAPQTRVELRRETKPQVRPDRLHQTAEGWAERYGPLYRFDLGRRQIVVVSDVDAVNAALRDRPDGFRRWREILEITEDVMLKWRLLVEEGRKVGHTFSQPDLIIAATALHHGLTVVTRDVSDYERVRAPVFNPWVAPPPAGAL